MLIAFTTTKKQILHCKYLDCTQYSFWQCYVSNCNLVVHLKLYSSMSVSVTCTAIGCNNHCQITVGNVTLPKAALSTFKISPVYDFSSFTLFSLISRRRKEQIIALKNEITPILTHETFIIPTI